MFDFTLFKNSSLCPSHYLLGDLFSALYYVEHFNWSLADVDRLSYTLVTFRAAVEYIRGKEVEKWLPKKVESASKVSGTPSCVCILVQWNLY